MKIFAVFLPFFLFLSNFCLLRCNVPPSTDGIFQRFQRMQQGKDLDHKVHPSAVFEKKGDSADSKVFDIHGMEQFKRIIIKNSYYKPVVLKLYLPTHKDIAQINEVFQDVAQNFNNNVIFAGLNVVQNMKLYQRIHNFCNLKNVELPLFLFYEKGQLKMPFLAGGQHKDYFVEYIQKMFFNAEQ
jgi:hypothetical protein